MAFLITKSLKNQLEGLVRHFCSATCFSYMANIHVMSNHSISKMNMAAFEKKETVVLENLHGNRSVCSFQELLLTFFYEETILLF